MIKKIFKKGNLPITILVIGIFALCGFALLTFFLSDFEVGNSFVGLDVTSKMVSNVDEYLFYKSVGVSEQDLDGIFHFTDELERRYFYEEKKDREGGFLFFGQREVLLFSVKYQVPSGDGF